MVKTFNEYKLHKIPPTTAKENGNIIWAEKKTGFLSLGKNFNNK